MVEHWYSVVHVADYRCATIIQIHHLTVKFLNVSHYIRNFKEKFSTGSKKSLYWLGHLGANYQRVLENFLHIPPEKTFTFAPCAEDFPSSGSRRETHFVHTVPSNGSQRKQVFYACLGCIFLRCIPKWYPMGLTVWGVISGKISPNGSRRERCF